MLSILLWPMSINKRLVRILRILLNSIGDYKQSLNRCSSLQVPLDVSLTGGLMVAACQGNFSLSLIAEKILAENLVRLPPIDLSEWLMRIFNKNAY